MTRYCHGANQDKALCWAKQPRQEIKMPCEALIPQLVSLLLLNPTPATGGKSGCLESPPTPHQLLEDLG